MSIIAGVSSNIIKKTFSFCYYTTSSFSTRKFPLSQFLRTQANVNRRCLALGGQNILPGTSPPEFPQAPPPERYSVPLEVPKMPNVPDFDPIPPEKPADPPPLSPDENPGPDFPGPPNPSPPKPDAPTPPLSPPEVVPPHGPEIMPSQPPDPGPPYPTQPDIPTPV